MRRNQIPFHRKLWNDLCQKIANNFHYVFDFDLEVLIIYFYIVCNAFAAVAKICIQSQAELVVCFCKATEPRWVYLATGTEEARGRGRTMGWHLRRAERKTFFFLKASESSGFWRTRFAAPAAVRGRAKDTEITDTSKRSFTPSQPHLLPYIHKVSHSHSRSQLVLAGP